MTQKISRAQQDAIQKWADALQRQKIDLDTASAAEIKRTLWMLPQELRGRSIDQLRDLARKTVDQGVPQLGLGGHRAGGASTGIGVRADANRQAAGAASTDVPDHTAGKTELSVREFLRAADGQMTYLQQALQKTRELKLNNDRGKEDIDGRRRTALSEVVEALLPGLDSAAFARAARITGDLTLTSESNYPARKLDSVKKEAEARLAEIEADPIFKQPAPDAALKTANADVAAVVALIARADREEKLAHLIENGYDTEKYHKGFLNLSKVSDGWAADDILTRFPEAGGSFKKLAALVTQARADFEGLNAKATALNDTVTKKKALDEEHGQKSNELSGGPGSTLARARASLAAFLLDADSTSIGPRIKDEPEVDLFKRFDGLQHQYLYLDDLGSKKLDPTEARLNEEMKLLQREIRNAQPYKDSNRTVPAAQVQQSFTNRAQMYTHQLDTYRQVQSNVTNYNSYNSAPTTSFFEMWFWWNMFTGGFSHHDEVIYVHDQQQFVPGGGQSGGAGATGTWDQQAPVQPVQGVDPQQPVVDPQQQAPQDPSLFFDNPAAGIGGSLYGPVAGAAGADGTAGTWTDPSTTVDPGTGGQLGIQPLDDGSGNAAGVSLGQPDPTQSLFPDPTVGQNTFGFDWGAQAQAVGGTTTNAWDSDAAAAVATDDGARGTERTDYDDRQQDQDAGRADDQSSRVDDSRQDDSSRVGS